MNAMLWPTWRAPGAAAIRFRVPSVRNRLVSAKSRSIRRGLIRAGIAVSALTTASGRKPSTTAATAPPSSASAALTPSPRPLREKPSTSWPASRSTLRSGRPRTPVAPATSTRMAPS